MISVSHAHEVFLQSQSQLQISDKQKLQYWNEKFILSEIIIKISHKLRKTILLTITDDINQIKMCSCSMASYSKYGNSGDILYMYIYKKLQFSVQSLKDTYMYEHSQTNTSNDLVHVHVKLSLKYDSP